MARKYKATGCARFFFALLIIAPIAYFGAAYYNGVDGVQQIKDWIGVESSENTSDDKMEKTIEELEEENKKLKEENKKLRDSQN